MEPTAASISRPAITKLLIGAIVMLGLLSLFVILAGNASAGDDATVTVNSTANIDDGTCEGAPNDDEIGNCTLPEAINMVNNGDADIINFHKPVFSKQQPGVIELCGVGMGGGLPEINRDVIIDSSNSGVVIDGGWKDEDCSEPATYGLEIVPQANGLDFTLIGGKNFDIVNIACAQIGNGGLTIDGFDDGAFSLGTIEITGVIIDNICGNALEITATNLESGSITNSEISSNEGRGIRVYIDACFDDPACELDDSVLDINGNRIFGGVEFGGGSSGAGNGEAAGLAPRSGVEIDYIGVLSSKITVSVSQNEVINGTSEGVTFDFLGCGSESGINVHVDENEEINGGVYDGVDISVFADACKKGAPCFTNGGGLAGQGPCPPCNGPGGVGVAGNVCPESCQGASGSAGCNEPCKLGVAGPPCDPCVEGTGVAGPCPPQCIDSLGLAGGCPCPGVSGVNGNPCPCPVEAAGNGPSICVDDGDTSDELDVVVTVNGNGDIESEGLGGGSFGEGVTINIFICCEESDSSATVEVNDNGRITGEDDGVAVNTWVCCGDDNSTDTSVNGNDEITGEGDDGISVHSFAGSSTAASGLEGLAGRDSCKGDCESDADDNVCIITVDGNNEIDGVGDDGVELDCFAGALGDAGFESGALVAGGPPLSSGDNNVSTITVTNNNDIDGDTDGVDIEGLSGSVDGEADDNTFTAIVSGNGEITGDDDAGIDVNIIAGTPVEEGDDNFAEIIIEENAEVGGNGYQGLDLDIFAGGITDGSEDNHTAVTIVQNGDIEGSGDSGDGDGIDIESSVCCDEANSNTITISNNKGEITGHDANGIDIDTCCSINIITIMDNEGNIRGGDSHGFELEICDVSIQDDIDLPGKFPGGAGNRNPVDFNECLKRDITHLTVINNSFSDSEDDGIKIVGGTYDNEELGIKSVISNNVIEGNGDDGIDIDSGNGLNIGPGNQIFENGTSSIDAGIEIDFRLADCEWNGGEGNKFPANHNTITQNSIWDNFGLGIDLVGFDPDEEANCDIGLGEGDVGCVPFPDTPIAANDCLPFPVLQTQSGDKLIGTACSECTVEVFWADDDPANQDDADGDPHGEGAVYLASVEADEDGSFSIELPCDLGPGDLTATATDKLKNTSEFAENLLTLGTSSCATDTPIATDTPVPTSTPAETDTPAPTNTLVPTSTPAPEKVCGDVNEDGVANSVDASLVLQFKAGLITSLPNESSGDVNGDGALTSVDAALLLQFTAGLISEDGLNCG